MGKELEEHDEVAKLCIQLDDLVLKVMEDLEALHQKKEVFNSLIEEGWFSLSKSRYAMGNKSVSTIQYGHTMIPLVRIHTSILKDGEMIFQAERRDPGTLANRENWMEGSDAVEDVSPADQAVRRRNVALNKRTKEEPVLSEDVQMEKPSKEKVKCSKQTEEQRSPIQDPLKWFGILVPQSLRQAQTSFQKVIELAADIATLQSHLQVAQKEYQTLLRQKLHLTKENV
ncbi:coiled-coil domain-containing protein 115 [Protopterus annectens]|uniref:coiled-coil domain-containing protein 115 n=1 Tax=Protopterus annectens TaxID=7888 RepID=UPI001CFA4725|nr:coiled-coil domain-containing protein 115 [Protopterus annectens]